VCSDFSSKVISLSLAESKRQDGRYFTARSPFSHPEFRAWAGRAGLPEELLIEPFAGSGAIIDMLKAEGLADRVMAYDLSPQASWIVQKDCFADFPPCKGVIITNPPYMARNSARRRGLHFPDTKYADAYQHALDLMLEQAGFVAAIVPAAFGTLDIFRDRLTHVIDLPFPDMFEDTTHPVCLSLFEPLSSRVVFWHWDRRIGDETLLRRALPDPPARCEVIFNVPEGRIGLRATDSTSTASIMFVPGLLIPKDRVKPSSRSITRLDIFDLQDAEIGAVIESANSHLDRIRRMTEDAILTPFKGVRRDGRFRRRLDYKTARIVLSLAVETVRARGGT